MSGEVVAIIARELLLTRAQVEWAPFLSVLREGRHSHYSFSRSFLISLASQLCFSLQISNVRIVRFSKQVQLVAKSRGGFLSGEKSFGV